MGARGTSAGLAFRSGFLAVALLTGNAMVLDLHGAEDANRDIDADLRSGNDDAMDAANRNAVEEGVEELLQQTDSQDAEAEQIDGDSVPASSSPRPDSDH